MWGIENLLANSEDPKKSLYSNINALDQVDCSSGAAHQARVRSLQDGLELWKLSKNFEFMSYLLENCF